LWPAPHAARALGRRWAEAHPCARRQGTKTQLDSGDEAPAAAPAAAAAEDAPAAEASAEARPALQQAAAPEPGLSAARVRKLARRALRAAPGGALKPRRLLRRVAAAGAGGLSLDALLAAVAGGGRLAMVGGRVVLGGAPAPA